MQYISKQNQEYLYQAEKISKELSSEWSVCPSVCTSPNIYLRCHHDCQDISHSDVYCPCHQDCGQEWVTNKTLASVSTPGISMVAPDITWKHQFGEVSFTFC